MTSTLQIDTDDRHVTTITLNRPEVRNAFDDRMIRELGQALADIDADSTTRCVVITGAGTAFCAGGDIQWMRSTAGFGEQENLRDAQVLAGLMATLNGLSKPTIARVNGHAFGGGVGLVSCCDIVIAAETAKLSLSEVRLGLVPAVISPYVVAAMGARQARRYFLSGEVFDAVTATTLQLVHAAVPAEAIDASIDAIVDNLLRGGPNALAESKRLIAMISGADGDALAALGEKTAQLIARLRASPEGQEGLGAFLEKRKPAWHPAD
ncbi:MAG: enoyl-CoA hydratase/isomerase family protein [Pseudomonadota bacterium]